MIVKTALEMDEITALAKEHDVPVMENAGLAELLGQMELGDAIPSELYFAVAHILAYAYKISLLENNED